MGAPLRPGPGAAVQGADAGARAAGRGALWAAYDAIRCPTLLVRGAQSDLLSHATAQADDAARTEAASWWRFAGVGHAPTFMHARPDRDAVREFLL